MDPFTIAVAISLIGGIAVAIMAITLKRIFQWFRARGQIKTENNQVIAFTLAERINNKQYVEVQGVFDNKPHNTRIIQGFYDRSADRIVEARALATSDAPDQEIIDRHDDGDGLVIYT